MWGIRVDVFVVVVGGGDRRWTMNPSFHPFQSALAVVGIALVAFAAAVAELVVVVVSYEIVRCLPLAPPPSPPAASSVPSARASKAFVRMRCSPMRNTSPSHRRHRPSGACPPLIASPAVVVRAVLAHGEDIAAVSPACARAPDLFCPRRCRFVLLALPPDTESVYSRSSCRTARMSAARSRNAARCREDGDEGGETGSGEEGASPTAAPGAAAVPTAVPPSVARYCACRRSRALRHNERKRARQRCSLRALTTSPWRARDTAHDDIS